LVGQPGWEVVPLARCSDDRFRYREIRDPGVVLSVLSLDFETRSTLELKDVGVYKYAQHPTTDVICMAYAFDDEEPEIWAPKTLTIPASTVGPYQVAESVWQVLLPEHVMEHIRNGGEVRGWNAGQFERIIWNEILVKRYGFPPLTIEQVVDTAVEAAAMSLPRALGYCARVLNVAQEKDDDGHKLMMQMCKPRKPRKGESKDALLWWDDTERLERLYGYCKQDVRAERAVAKVLRRLSPAERAVYLLDQRVNDRGVRVDLDLVRAARRIVDRGTEAGNRELGEITAGACTGVTKLDDLKEWLAGRGFPVETLDKPALRDLLAGELPEDVRRALTIRRDCGKSSTAKLDSFEDATCDDSRARGLFLYHGAGTGRWAGKLIQTQNFPRPAIKDIERFIPDVLAGNFDFIEMEEPAVGVVSDMLRSMMVASPGCILRQGDYAQIEARVLAWIAEQDDLVELFAQGGKIYEEMAAYIFDVPLDQVTPFMRQIGKNSILGAGYQMGPDRFAEQVFEQTGIVLDRGKRGEDGELLPGEVDIAAKAIYGYRAKNSKIKQFWPDIYEAAVNAVMNPGSVHAVGRRGGIKFIFKGQWLWCQLPSGRFLAYAKPEMRKTITPWGRKKKAEGLPLEESDFRVSLTYMGIDTLTKKWWRLPTYGGHLTENVVQAMSRDLLADAMLRLEERGYPVVLHAHDEIVCDVPEGHGSQEEFLSTMSARPEWAFDIPVKVEGWAGERYRK
jgi:DNA polymerase